MQVALVGEGGGPKEAVDAYNAAVAELAKAMGPDFKVVPTVKNTTCLGQDVLVAKVCSHLSSNM